MPAAVATSKLPKWPVRISTPLPRACASRSTSSFSTRASPARRSGGQQRKPEELDDQAPDVRVVRLREPRDLALRTRCRRRPGACSPAPLRADTAGGGRPASRTTGPRCAQRQRERDRRGAGAVMGQRQCDALQPVAGQRIERGRCALDLRCAVVVAGDREVGDADGPQRGLAREQLQARFLRSEARGQAGGAARTVAAVLPFLARRRS